MTTSETMLYGLRIRSVIDLPGRPAEGSAKPDVEIVYGPTIERQSGPPPGDVLAHHELAPDKWYTFTRLPDASFIMRIVNVCDFLLTPGLDHVEARVVKGGTEELVPVFAAGALPSFILLMQGEPVLHASAVDLGGHVMAFLGRSGMGKSTMATLFCAAGGRLVTDDVLRVTQGPGPRCYLGPQELRLRAWADELTADFSERPDISPTGDGRSAVRAQPSQEELLPLSTIIIPLPDRQSPVPIVKRLPPGEALLALIRFPRIVGWQDGPSHGQLFRVMADLNQAVPVYTARVPWGPPFPVRLAQELLSDLSLEAPLLLA